MQASLKVGDRPTTTLHRLTDSVAAGKALYVISIFSGCVKKKEEKKKEVSC